MSLPRKSASTRAQPKKAAGAHRGHTRPPHTLIGAEDDSWQGELYGYVLRWRQLSRIPSRASRRKSAATFKAASRAVAMLQGVFAEQAATLRDDLKEHSHYTAAGVWEALGRLDLERLKRALVSRAHDTEGEPQRRGRPRPPFPLVRRVEDVRRKHGLTRDLVATFLVHDIAPSLKPQERAKLELAGDEDPAELVEKFIDRMKKASRKGP